MSGSLKKFGKQEALRRAGSVTLPNEMAVLVRTEVTSGE